MSTKRDLQAEMKQFRNAESLLQLGARVPIVMEMTRLSSWFLRKLSREIHGEAPRKGQVPNSDQWYLRRRNNLQASLFCSFYDAMKQSCTPPPDECHLLIHSYRQLQQAVSAAGIRDLMPLDRAWWLVKALKIRSLQRACCQVCQGRYLQPWGRVTRHFICWNCRQNGYRINGRGVVVASLPQVAG